MLYRTASSKSISAYREPYSAQSLRAQKKSEGEGGKSARQNKKPMHRCVQRRTRRGRFEKQKLKKYVRVCLRVTSLCAATSVTPRATCLSLHSRRRTLSLSHTRTHTHIYTHMRAMFPSTSAILQEGKSQTAILTLALLLGIPGTRPTPSTLCRHCKTQPTYFDGSVCPFPLPSIGHRCALCSLLRPPPTPSYPHCSSPLRPLFSRGNSLPP